jgi:hypothetical protein
MPVTLAANQGVNAAQNGRHLQFELNASNPAEEALERGRQTSRMTDAMTIGAAGLRAAEARVNVRAQNIANWLSEDYRPLEPEQTTDESGAPRVRVSRPPELQGEYPVVDTASELVDMKMAQRAYEASAKVMRTADEMSKTLLDAFA